LRSSTTTIGSPPPIPAAAGLGTSARAREIDRDTVALCNAGDEAAYARFVQHYERAVTALLYRVLGPHADIEDLAQEAFLRAFRALPRFSLDGPAAISTWLLTIATRLALNDKRRARTSGVVASEVEPLDPRTPEHSYSQAELGVAIERALASLPIEQRAAFILAEFHGMTMAELAEALEIPENTAKTRIFRAREKMRALLAPHWREP
jgi:RNA polymerase sigma-70 factor (ECF subfamily)